MKKQDTHELEIKQQKKLDKQLEAIVKHQDSNMIVVTRCVQVAIERRQKAKVLRKKRTIKKPSRRPALKPLDMNANSVVLCEL